MQKLKIKSIKQGTKRHVNDLNVPKNHNFFILDNGILTHNCDYLTPNSQAGLRSFSEEYSKNCGFIFTCNFKNRIIKPLQSRFSNVDFTIENSKRPALASKFFNRVIHILDQEGVEYEKTVIAKVVEKYFPDFRKILNELQHHAASGRIDEGIFTNFKQESINILFGYLKDQNFTEMRKWVAENSDQDFADFYSKIYKTGLEKVQMSSIPSFVTILAKYQYQHAFVPDHELNLTACLVEILCEVDFE